MKKSFFFIGVFIGVNTHAAEFTSWNVSGYVAQALSYSTDNNFLGKTDDNINTEFSESALFARGELLDRLSMSLQVLSRQAGATENNRPRLDYLFLTYEAKESLGLNTGIKLGRIKRASTFYNDTRDNPFTRSTIYLPQSLYFERWRNFLTSFDGIAFYLEREIDFGRFGFSGGYGQTQSIGNKDDTFSIGGLLQREMEPDVDRHLQLTFENVDAKIRTNLSYYDLNNAYTAASNRPILQDGTLNFATLDGHYAFKATSIGIEYNELVWSVSAEIAHATTDMRGFNPQFTQKPIVSKMGYLQFCYRFTPEISLLAREDIQLLDSHASYKRSAIFLDAGFKPWIGQTRDFTIGINWEPSTHWKIMAETHVIKGTSWLNTSNITSPRDLREHWMLTAVEFAYRF